MAAFIRHPAGRANALSVAVLALLVALAAPAAVAGEVTIFAAASLTNALAEVGHAYEEHSDNTVRFSFASSSTLARQIAEGAPADIYVSADIRWMNYLEKSDAIQPDSRKNLLANQLALVAPTDSDLGPVDIHPGFALAQMLDHSRLAMGNPLHVPAGIYGKQALQSLGVWSSVKNHIARSANVRAALALVALGAAPLGIVYRTDAFAANKVRIVGIFPKNSHKPIVYPAAVTQRIKSGNAAVYDFYQFMDSDQADKIFESYGFRVLDD